MVEVAVGSQSDHLTQMKQEIYYRNKSCWDGKRRQNDKKIIWEGRPTKIVQKPQECPIILSLLLFSHDVWTSGKKNRHIFSCSRHTCDTEMTRMFVKLIIIMSHSFLFLKRESVCHVLWYSRFFLTILILDQFIPFVYDPQ